MNTCSVIHLGLRTFFMRDVECCFSQKKTRSNLPLQPQICQYMCVNCCDPVLARCLFDSEHASMEHTGLGEAHRNARGCAQAVFGIGVGGEYPIASTSASERAEADVNLQHRRGETVMLTFSMQGACGARMLSGKSWYCSYPQPETAQRTTICTDGETHRDTVSILCRCRGPYNCISAIFVA